MGGNFLPLLHYGGWALFPASMRHRDRVGIVIAAKPLAARASVLGGLGAVGMFATTLSFLLTTPGVWQEDHGAPKLSMVGQFLIKDSVFLGAALLASAESLRAARAGR